MATRFENYDDESVFERSQNKALDESTHNFVVDFGRDATRIVFDVTAKETQELLAVPKHKECPIRWM